MNIKAMIAVIVLALALIIGLTCKYFFKVSNTPVELLAEKIVLDETGVDIDFNGTDTTLFKNSDELLQKLECTIKNSSDAIKHSKENLMTTTK